MDGLEALQQRVEALAGLADVDPAALSGEQALAWATGVVSARNVLDALAAPLLRRVEELSEGPSRFARWKGFPNAAALLSGVTGLAASDAHRLLALGKAIARTVEVASETDRDANAGLLVSDGRADDEPLGSCGGALPPGSPTALPIAAPAPVRMLSPLARAARDGRLGAEKIRIIETTVEAMRINTASFEADAVTRAATLSLRQLRVWCLEQFAERDPDAYSDRQSRQRGDRFLAFTPQADGMVRVSGLLDAAVAAPTIAWFGAEVREAMAAQRDWDEVERRSVGQINADVLAALARHAQGCEHATTRPKTTVVVRVSHDVLERGAGLASSDSLEGPIDYGVLRRVAVDAEFLPVVLGGDSLPLDLGRARRGFSKAQGVALGERDGGCAMCTAPIAWCDAHHIQFWSRRGRSDLRNGVLLCVGCHHRVHDCGWAIEVDAKGVVSFIPPATVDPFRRRQPASSERLAS